MAENVQNVDGWSIYDLLELAGADETGNKVNLPNPFQLGSSQFRTLYVWGTFNGTTVILELSPDGENWFSVPNADTITAESILNIEFRAPFVRARTSGGTSPAVNVSLI